MTGISENIWFDGVNKKLIETHSKKKSLTDGDDETLTTKTPLERFPSLTKAIKKGKRSNTETSQFKGNLHKTDINNPTTTSRVAPMRPHTGVTEELAIDCEMVECFHHKSVLARVSIVNLFGHPILDRYVAPPAKVTDYRTRWSGIRRKDLEDAPDFDKVQKEVADLINGRIVVGHSVRHDFIVLKLTHPADKIRDTSIYYKYLFQGRTPSLKKLSESVLGLKIQDGEHDSVQDAQATMKLYVRERDKWNERVLKGDFRLISINIRDQKKKPLKKRIKTFYTMT